MKYYKTISGGFILSIGTGGMGEEITEAEYNEILSVIRNKPTDTDTVGYRLRENLTWEQYEKDPPDPDADIDVAEILDILMGVV